VPEDAAVGAWLSQNFDLEFEVFEVVIVDWPDVSQPGQGTAGHDRTVLNLEALVLTVGRPTIQGLAIKERLPLDRLGRLRD
jgi:hypothetical protein